MKIKKSFGDKIYINWIDAYTDDGWTTYEKAIEESTNAFCKTNAFYVGQSKNFIVVSHTQGQSKENSLMGVLSIPKEFIKAVK